jgi:phosphomannomutase
MSSEPIISVSVLRGIVGESLTTDVAQRYVRAFVAGLPDGPIVIGRDGRASGPLFASVIGEAIAATGRDVLDAGPGATPTIGVLVRELKAAGGIQISASHNPPQYNGIKLFNTAGRVLPAAEGQRVLDRYREDASTAPTAGNKGQPGHGRVSAIPDAMAPHLRLIERICDADRIRGQRFRVLLDSNHGAGGALGRALLERLGCELVVLGEQPDGAFEHPPEPTEANLATVLDQVLKTRAVVGFCQDPDADRLAIIDERGRYIGEEKTLALCVEHVLRRGRRGAVVTNCSTSRISEDIARNYGAPFFRSKVGEANVVDLMLEKNAVIGGEGNGGVIDPRVGYVRDSFVGMALVLDAMAARRIAVGELADALPQYAIYKAAITVSADKTQQALDALERHFTEATADRLDGLRLDWPSGAWLLVRPSNTEPIVRVIAEAVTLEEAKRLCDEAAGVITP